MSSNTACILCTDLYTSDSFFAPVQTNLPDANKSNTNWSTASYPDPDPENDAFSNEINYSNQQNVSKTIDEWQLNNDKTNTFFTGGGTLINSKDKDTQDLYTAGIDILNVLETAMILGTLSILFKSVNFDFTKF